MYIANTKVLPFVDFHYDCYQIMICLQYLSMMTCWGVLPLTTRQLGFVLLVQIYSEYSFPYFSFYLLLFLRSFYFYLQCLLTSDSFCLYTIVWPNLWSICTYSLCNLIIDPCVTIVHFIGHCLCIKFIVHFIGHCLFTSIRPLLRPLTC